MLESAPSSSLRRNMDRTFLALASVLGFTGVAAGAFGAHALRGYFAVHPETQATFETAVQYQILHALALGLAAWASTCTSGVWAVASGWSFSAGIVLFSGSLYLLSLTRMRALGAVTPLGGLALLTGWALLGLAAWRG